MVYVILFHKTYLSCGILCVEMSRLEMFNDDIFTVMIIDTVREDKTS